MKAFWEMMKKNADWQHVSPFPCNVFKRIPNDREKRDTGSDLSFTKPPYFAPDQIESICRRKIHLVSVPLTG